MCPWHVGRAILSVIWEDDIRPVLVKALIITVYVGMGVVAGSIVVAFTMLLYKFITLF